MSDSSERPVPIRSAEREIGLSKDTLRGWERRYGFPAPLRDEAGERFYPPDQVARLRLMRRLVDAGRRPGQLVSLSMAELEQLVHDATGGSIETQTGHPDHERCFSLLRGHDATGLSRQLHDACVRLGLERFIVEQVAPLTTQIGDAWMRGQLAIYEEHLFSELLQGVLRTTIARLPDPPAPARPRVLLTTFVDEPHGLGLLMAQGLLLLDGAPCVCLGTETPIWDIAQAARAFRVDIVALSFTGAMNPNPMVEGLTDLRGRLAADVELWAGGAAPALHRRGVPGVVVMATLARLRAEVARWRRAAST